MAIETLGLTLAEGKLILKRIQENVIREQVQDALLRQRNCTECGKARHSKGHHDITIRTLFGNIELKSPRLEHCRCQPQRKRHSARFKLFFPSTRVRKCCTWK